MFRKLGLALSFALVLGGIGLTAPASTFAATNPADPDGNVYTINLAGRPINGWTYDDASAPFQWYNPCGSGSPCWGNYATYGTGLGIAYAKVDGQIVLLYPKHGRDDPSYDGKYVWGPNGSKIGYFADIYNPNGTSSVCSADYGCIQDHDLSYIILYQGNWPANLNRVYRGSQGGSPVTWEILDPIPSRLGCDGLANADEDGSYVADNFVKDINSYTSYRSGHILDSYISLGAGKCLVELDIESHSYDCQINGWGDCQRDSGSPIILTWGSNGTLDQWTVFALVSSQNPSNGNLQVTPLFEGMRALWQHYNALGSSAALCRTPTCT